MAKDTKEKKETVGVLMDLPIKVHARLKARAVANDRCIKQEAERIIRLTVMADGTGVPCGGNTTTKQEG